MRPPGDITDLIRRLKKWRAARARIAQNPDRQGKPLPNTELDEAITYLTEYRDMVNKAQRAADLLMRR